MEYNAVGWFEIPVKDLKRAKKFYEELTGFTLEHMEMPGMEMEVFPWDENKKGCAGGLAKNEYYEPSDNGTIVYFTIPNLDEALEKVESIGGEILVPKRSIGEHGFIAWLKDTEGNRIAIHSREG